MDIRYTTDRLVLLIPDSGMAPLLLDYLERNKDDFSKWERRVGDEYYTLGYQEYALEAEQKLYLRSMGVRYYLFLKDDPDMIIGNISFAYLTEDDGHRCTIGYRIDSNFRQKGYAYEAASFLIPLIHKSYNIKRIEADILPENIASTALAQKLGFEYEGIARQSHTVAGVERDHLRFSLILDN